MKRYKYGYKGDTLKKGQSIGNIQFIKKNVKTVVEHCYNWLNSHIYNEKQHQGYTNEIPRIERIKMKLNIETLDTKYTYLPKDDCDFTLIIRNGKIVEALQRVRKEPSEAK